MKFITILLLSVISLNTFANCDYSKDIKENADGSYTYSKDCHLEFGRSLKKIELKDLRLKELDLALEDKDQVIDKQNQRINNWMTTSQKLEDRVNAVEKINDTNKIIYFVLGIAMTSLSVWGASQLRR